MIRSRKRELATAHAAFAESDAAAAVWKRRAEKAEAERDEWKAAAEGADPAADRAEKRYASLVAAIQAGLDTAPRCMHKPWPCGRENCSRGRYAAGLAKALELAGGRPENGSDDDGPAGEAGEPPCT
jgi:hypothetical protein